jgi:hypothetical protein
VVGPKVAQGDVYWGFLRNHSGRLPPTKMQAILRGIDTMLGR